ncbi:TPA: class IIb bacteriocin, lactobin A/cerein 7B family [Bacillus thuringiensis]|uniref:class IIb bacteriocin, lactobin A/cerein 7B family n=1 Tax=Bacillus TaxID=1386 RepID=UPI000BF4EE22|nr:MULTISPECIES: class IIb bacteriocin, lactobin A/cerein 7B family [Bacillus cereus group]MCH4568615.1 class IIb bacteriocin, lactobin A/cerein 7B family [Bacillus sp. ES1-5]MCG3426741.1 class IIb bacteriocin, lactobin A/cerein 7B family [Bacillus thuringiensis]MDA1636029.1 class IIb bacteriocin, lactobin A/cerein 7B family [Bacillus cereus]PFL68408.1 bacteriocin [Bacillus cereus]HDR8183502.1 class IIb bacteriocin, lactobin A/cerein 7B family [Bacillus thuringiensis]
MLKESLLVNTKNMSVEELSFDETQKIDGGVNPWVVAGTVGGVIALGNEVYKFGGGVVDGWKAAGKRKKK